MQRRTTLKTYTVEKHFFVEASQLSEGTIILLNVMLWLLASIPAQAT
jgi:hypothetical protein